MRKQLLPLGIILLTALLLAPFLRDFMREFVVIPVAYIFWIGRLVFDAIPQATFWGCFLIIALLLAGTSLLKNRNPRSKINEVKLIQRGRVETWANLIHQATQEDYYQWRLAQPLRELVLETLAHEARLTSKEVKQHLLEDELDLPAELQAYLQASLKSLTYLSTPRFRFLSRGLASPLDLDPESVVKFLEERSPER